MSSFGVGELGLHLCYETPATIALRRAIGRDPALARDVLGRSLDDGAVPAILSYERRRTFLESVGADAHGFGRLTISMLDSQLPIPLLRYQTGDVVKILDPETVAAALRRHGFASITGLPPELLALQGREKDRLPNGSHVAVYKDALYADPAIARQVTGAVRLTFAGAACTVHVQLIRDAPANTGRTGRLIEVLPAAARPSDVVWWPYERFPFGMTLDYERKFQHYVGGV
jgi:hypothetical protein